MLSLHREGTGETLRIVFRAGPTRYVADGYWYSGSVGDGRGGLLNLHEPGVVRRLLNEAASREQLPRFPGEKELDGWPLFDAIIRTGCP